MAQDLLDGGGVVDHGDQAQAPVAARAGQDVEPEGPAHQIRPEPTACTPSIRIRRVRVDLPVGAASRGTTDARQAARGPSTPW